MSQGGDVLGDRPDAIQPQGIDDQTPERGVDLHAIVLQVTLRVFPQSGVAGLVPAVLAR